MEIAFIVVAFLMGFAAAAVRLPPLVGYLVAGFVLHAFGYESTEAIDVIAELGVLLLLFGIGLKLKLATLARPVVWAGASLHMGATTAVVGAVFIALGALGMPLASELSAGQALLIGFRFLILQHRVRSQGPRRAQGRRHRSPAASPSARSSFRTSLPSSSSPWPSTSRLRCGRSPWSPW